MRQRRGSAAGEATGRGLDATAEGIRALGHWIAGLPLVRVERTMCRAVRARHLVRTPPEPLYHLGSAAFGARYTPLGGPPGLYLASDQPTAYAEIQDLFRGAGGKPLPLRPGDPVLTVYVVTRVRGVLDLTDARVRRALGVSQAAISGEWRAEMEGYLAGSSPMPLTQQIGAAAHATGRVRGILFPSARWKGGTCMVVFPDRLDPAEGDRVHAVDATGTYAQRLP
jgi:RES domain-containing protein